MLYLIKLISQRNAVGMSPTPVKNTRSQVVYGAAEYFALGDDKSQPVALDACTYMKDVPLRPVTKFTYTTQLFLVGTCYVCTKPMQYRFDSGEATQLQVERCCKTCWYRFKDVQDKGNNMPILRWRYGYYCIRCFQPQYFFMHEHNQAMEWGIAHLCATCKKSDEDELAKEVNEAAAAFLESQEQEEGHVIK
jgi:hypothetical protein